MVGMTHSGNSSEGQTLERQIEAGIEYESVDQPVEHAVRRVMVPVTVIQDFHAYIEELEFRNYMTVVAYRMARREARVATRSLWTRVVDWFRYLRKVMWHVYTMMTIYAGYWIEWFQQGPDVEFAHLYRPVPRYRQWLDGQYYQFEEPAALVRQDDENDDEGEHGD